MQSWNSSAISEDRTSWLQVQVQTSTREFSMTGKYHKIPLCITFFNFADLLNLFLHFWF